MGIQAMIETDGHRQVTQATWGHLAAKKGKIYHGRIVYAVGIYGSDRLNPTVLLSEFEGLSNSPWEYDAVQAFLQYKDTPKDEGCVYEFVGSMQNYECKGTIKKIFDAEVVGK